MTITFEGIRVEATQENALKFLESKIQLLRPPKYSFDTLNVIFPLSYNYDTNTYSILTGCFIHETDDPIMNPDIFRWVLMWDKEKWVVVSQEYFDEVWGN